MKVYRVYKLPILHPTAFNISVINLKVKVASVAS